MIGLAGAHRTGKTTLARAFAEQHKIKFVETSASQVFRSMGLDPAVHYDFSTRLNIQEKILESLDAVYAEHAGFPAIADRTPIDMLGYTLAEALHDAVPADEMERLDRYVAKCFDVVNKRFAAIVVVQPGIPILSEEGKATINKAYIEHLNSLIMGLAVDDRVKIAHFYIPRYIVGVEDRLGALDFAVTRVKKRAEMDLQDCTVH